MATAQFRTVVQHIRSLVADEKTDGGLLRAFLTRNDHTAFEALLRRHGPMVLGVCMRTLGHVHDAEDAFQATFITLARQGASIRKHESLSSWLHGVAHRMATHAKRAAARRHKHESKTTSAQPRDPALCAAWQELQVLLDQEIARLPETLRAPFINCCLENKSCAEAAQQLNLHESTVSKRLSRARKLLQNRLARRGVSIGAVLAAAAVGTNGAMAAVPQGLVGTTVEAAAHIAAGHALTSALAPATVISLVMGMKRALLVAKCKATLLALVSTAAVGGLGLLALHGASPEKQGARPSLRLAALASRRPQASPPAKIDAKDVVNVRGSVFGPDGKPFAGAKLYLGYAASTDTNSRTTSGADGRFQFSFSESELKKIDSYYSTPQVMAIAEGHGCDWVEIDSAKAELTLHLAKDLAIIGQILDSDRKPVAGATLKVWAISAAKGDLDEYLKAVRQGEDYQLPKFWRGPLPGQPEALATGADGRFRLAGAGRERVVIFRVEGPNIAWTTLDVMTRSGDPVENRSRRLIYGATSRIYGTSFTFVGSPTRLIRGVVRDKATGKPLDGASVGEPGSSWFTTLTNRAGEFELHGWAKKGDYALLAKPSDGLHFQHRVEVHDTPGLGSLTCDIDLARGLRVHGRVSDKATDKPVVGARVDYHPLGGNSYVDQLLPGSWDPRAETATDSAGSYAITVLPGPGVIGVIAPNLADYMPAAVTLKERKDFFKTPLVNDKDEDFLSRYAGGKSWGSIGVDFYNALVLLEPDQKEETLVRNVALERPQERTGRVVGPDDRPLPGVTVYGLVRFGIDTLDQDVFTVRGVNPKAHRPLVFHHKKQNLGFYLKDLRDAAPGPLTIKLEPCGSASGRVVNRAGRHVPGLHLQVLGQALRITSEAGGGCQEVTTDKDGRFRVEGLVPLQPYAVWEWQETPSLPRIYAPVAVQSGRHKDMGDIKMERD